MESKEEITGHITRTEDDMLKIFIEGKVPDKPSDDEDPFVWDVTLPLSMEMLSTEVPDEFMVLLFNRTDEKLKVAWAMKDPGGALTASSEGVDEGNWVAAQSSLGIPVRFLPGDDSAHENTLIVKVSRLNDQSKTFSVPISARLAAPTDNFSWDQIVVTPATDLSFGPTDIGKSKEVSVIVENNSEEEVQLAFEIQGDDSFFLPWGNDPYALKAGEEVPILVEFTPSANTPYSGELDLQIIRENGFSNKLYDIALTGSGIALPEEPTGDVGGGLGRLDDDIRPTPEERANTEREPNGKWKPNQYSELKSVSMAAPNIVEVVIRDRNVHSFQKSSNWSDKGVNKVIGNSGDQLRDLKNWSITNGRIGRIHSQSKPRNQGWLDKGFSKNTWITFMDLDHHLFFVLDDPITGSFTLRGPQQKMQNGSMERWSIVYNTNLMNVTSSIQVNQVGYSPKGEKRYAYISNHFGDGGGLTEAPDEVRVLRGGIHLQDLEVKKRRSFDNDTGSPVWQVDISHLPIHDQSYEISWPKVGRSFPFHISYKAPLKGFYKTLRALTYNRWGREIKMPFSDWPPRPPAHTLVYKAENHRIDTKFPIKTPKDKPMDMPGLHCDAGDFDIRHYHYVVPMILMNAYEAHPEAHYDGQCDLPEQNDGLPDILTEAYHALKGWMALQEPSGGVRSGAESHRHPWGRYYADEDQLDYWTYSIRADHTARCAAIFAQMARIVTDLRKKSDNPEDISKLIRIAEKLYDAAHRAYDYATTHGITEEDGGPMLWAAGSMFRLFGHDKHKEAFERTFNRHAKHGGAPDLYKDIPWMSSYKHKEQPALGEFIVDYALASGADPGIKGRIIKAITEAANESKAAIQGGNAHRSPRKGQVTWGRGSAPGRFVMNIACHARLTGGLSTDDISHLSHVFDYIFGCNPNNMSWIVGLGLNYPTDILHLDSMAYKHDGAPPIDGFTVYGPTDSPRAHQGFEPKHVLWYPAYKDVPVMRRYTDVWTEIQCNEFTIDTQAFQIFTCALMIDSKKNTRPHNWAPGKEHHRTTFVTE